LFILSNEEEEKKEPIDFFVLEGEKKEKDLCPCSQDSTNRKAIRLIGLNYRFSFLKE